MNRVLVTGGAGFIGSHVVDRLLAAGRDVVILDDLSCGRRDRLSPGARLVVQDIADPATIGIVEKERPDAILHFAAQIDVRKSMADPAFDARVNVVGSLNLMEGARRAGTRTFVFASTGGAIYGDEAPVPTLESAPAVPASIYGASKLSVEKYLGVYHVNFGLSFAALRFANVYGPRQDPHGEAGVVAIFCQRLLKGEPCTIYGDGRQTRDYVFVGDVADACVRALDLEGARSINIGTGVELDVVGLYGELRALSDVNREAVFAPARAGEQRRSAIDASLARQLLGWVPRVEVREGLARTWEWFRSRPPA
jgi:UDP-glucose 4-epimerase